MSSCCGGEIKHDKKNDKKSGLINKKRKLKCAKIVLLGKHYNSQHFFLSELLSFPLLYINFFYIK